MLRFVRPETATLYLEGGDTLTVRRRLTAGEARGRVERWTERDPVTGELRPVYTRSGLATVTAYLLDWTGTDDAGRPLASLQGLGIAELEAFLDNNLSPEAFQAIREAIEAHEAAMSAEREAEKKRMGRARRRRSRDRSPLWLAVRVGNGPRRRRVQILVAELVREQDAAAAKDF